ncbi:EamA family transporter RarD [Halofilum ochraceum]|uniref:EamA family transporter RarD n=1 Tax=Halofilum ochraceum TaxID=1611323 RepID=UPI001C308837|nr:EamA family transporter RarD [Halofilum ochraceum]
MSGARPIEGMPSALPGVAYALGSFGLWGLFPLYFKAVSSVPAPEVLAHRVVWSVVFVGVLLLLVRQWGTVGAILADRRRRYRLIASSLLISANWLIFIWAVAHDRVLEASLGYFITPLVSVLLGRVVLGERLFRVQWLAVGLAAVGVTWMLVGVGVVPWVALGLAATFGSYGLVRKLADVPAIPGLFVETLIVGPPALAYLLWLGLEGAGEFGARGVGFDGLLIAAGLVTATPLILFAQATRRLRLASVGLFQYIVPTMQMLLAVFAFGEVFTPQHAITFGCIWIGLALYSASAFGGRERARGVVR